MTNEQLVQVIKVLDAIGLHVLSISPEKFNTKEYGAPMYTNKTVLIVIPASEEK
jgi:hypothetical protein